MKLLWASAAEQDRAAIFDHIAASNPLAAIAMDERFAEATALLTNQSLMGKPGRIPGTREWVPHESYRLVYEVQGDTVWVLALIHTARMWPPVA